MTNDTIKTKEYPELWIDPALRDFCISSYHESPDPGVEHFLILYIMAHRIWDGAYKNWCDVPLNDISKFSKFGTRRLQRALDHLESIGVVRGSKNNNLAAPRRQPKRYKLMSKTQRWPLTPSSNSAVAKEVERKVESARSRSPVESKKPLHAVPVAPYPLIPKTDETEKRNYQDFLKLNQKQRTDVNSMRIQWGMDPIILKEGDV